MKFLDNLRGRFAGGRRSESQSKYRREFDAMTRATYAARAEFYATLGSVEPDVIAHIVNPAFTGAPAWPSLRQAWCVIRRPDSVIIASDGLSDPFEAGPRPLGFGLELCAEVPISEAMGTLHTIARSWPFDLLYQVAMNVADHGAVAALLERYSTLSMMLPAKFGPDGFRNEEERTGVVIGFPAIGIPGKFETPYGPVKMAVMTPLTTDELLFIERGEDMAAARAHVIELLRRTPLAHLCVESRASVVS